MPHDLLGLGNAVVDVLAEVPFSFLSREDLLPGSMRLIDAVRAQDLASRMPAPRLFSGGSAANTCAVAAMLGARVAFLGMVADDAAGAAFRADIGAAGVHYPTPPLAGQAPTAQCLVLVTPDGQRTMNTYLGACLDFGVAALDEALIAGSAITYLEGYLFDPPAAQDAFHRAAHLARAAGNRVALTLSDAFCVDRHRSAFLDLLPRIDILFANEAEITSLYECDRLEDAAARARRDVALAVLTRSERGSMILSAHETLYVDPVPAQVVDTTGAGDCYAAGFLTALTRGDGLAACGALGSRAASACIARIGARPPHEVLRELAPAMS
jgi:fructokinase